MTARRRLRGMAEIEFGITYDGPALADGRMPVRDLAPALLALGELFTEASVVAYPDREPVAVHVRATKEGSFVVQMVLQSADAWDQVINIFSSKGADALSNLFAFVLPAGTGVVWLIRRLHGREIEHQEEL